MVDLNKYLAEKYGLDLQGAEQQYQDQASSINTANLFSNLGDVIAGNKVGSNNAIFQQLNKQAKEDTIGRVKAEKEQMIADYDLNKKLKSDSDRNDKTSESAKFAQDSLVQVGFSPELVKNKSLNELESLSPYTKMIIDKQRQEQERKFKQEENQLKRQENQLKRQDLNKDINRLPEEDKIVVKDLASANAKKISIANQIDAVLDQSANLTDAQKLQQGRQLIKTLNSSQGQDAVGAEEAKRLAGKLEFAFGGVTSGNYGQLGRDVKGFFEDAKITSDSLKSSIDQNNKIIQGAYSRVGLQKDPSAIYNLSNDKKPALETKEINGQMYQKVNGGWQKIKKDANNG